MNSSLLYKSLQPSGAVTSAHSVPTTTGLRDRLLCLHDTHLTACSVNSSGLEREQTWGARQSTAHMVYLPNDYVLLLSKGGHCSLHSLPQAADATPQLLAYASLPAAGDGSPNQQQPFNSAISNVMSAPVGSGIASLLALAHQDSALHILRAAPTAAGGMSLQIKAMPYKQVLLRCSFPDLSGSPLLSVRVHSRVLNLLWLSTSEQHLDLQGNALLAVLHEFSPSSQPPVLHVDCLAVDWQQGSITPGPWSVRNVHPTTRLLQSFAGYGQLPAGILIISSKGVLLCSCLGDTAAAAATAAQPSSSSTAAVAAGADVQKVQIMQWRLTGVPLSCAAVANNAFIVGDDRAELHMLLISLSGVAVWRTLVTSAPLAVPHVLVHMPVTSHTHSTTKSDSSNTDSMQVGTLGDQQQQQEQEQQQQQQQQQSSQLAGLLFIGSRSSSSQVLGLPAELLKHEQQQQQQGSTCPMLQSAFLPSLSGAQAVAVLQDPTGALPEHQLLVACGAAPCGKLAVVRSGVGLMPLMMDGPQLPGDAVLFAVEDHPTCQLQQPMHHHQQQQHKGACLHDLLGFSFPSAGVSDVLSVGGSTFKQVSLPGLQQQQQSLLMAGLPGGWLLQVTAAGVWVLDKHGRGLQHSWSPDDSPISLAAVSDSRLVVACGDRVAAFTIDCCTGALAEVGVCRLQQQASSLALLTLSDGSFVVAVGLWVHNQLLLLPWPAAASAHQQQQRQHTQEHQVRELDVCCVADLYGDQVRSVAVLPVGQDDVLMVGTNSGTVIYWHIVTAAQQQQQQTLTSGTSAAVGNALWLLLDGRKVQVSSSSVSLQQVWLPAVHNNHSRRSSGASDSRSDNQLVACVYAHAGAGVVFSAIPQLVGIRQQLQQHSGSGSVTVMSACDCVRASRVCGSEASSGAAVLHTPDMPNTLAWLSGTSRLCFGALDTVHKLRWRSRPLQGTPLAMTLHKPTNTVLVLVQADSSGPGWQQQQLVLLDGRSLDVSLVLGLAPGHSYTSLAVLELPCTAAAAQRQQPHCSSEAARGAHHTTTQEKCRPFIVLGSRVSLGFEGSGGAGKAGARSAKLVTADAAVPFETAPAQQGTPKSSGPGTTHDQESNAEVGMLSFFELNMRLADASSAGDGSDFTADAAGAGTASGSRLMYDVVLHGMVPVPFIPASMCTVTTERPHHQQGQYQQQAVSSPGHKQTADSRRVAEVAVDHPAGAAVPGGPHLCVGCEEGVVLYEVLVDTAHSWSATQLRDTLAQAAQVSNMEQDGCLAAQHNAPEQQSTSHHQQQEQAGVGLHVSLVPMSSCSVLSGGVVVSLQSSGSSMIACEALGSVTVIKALATAAGGVQLLPVGADRSGLMAMDVVGTPPPLAAPQVPSAAAAQISTGVAQPESTGPCSSAAAAAAAVAAAGGGSHTSHQALLVATHPEGLLLLQRDLTAEQEHQQLVREVAVRAWEAGITAGDMLAWQQQQQDLLAAAAHPWLGAGEAAPWAAAGVEGRPQQQHWQEAAAGQAAQRAALAAVAMEAAAAGEAGALAIPPVVNPRAAEAPWLIPSAACAPAAGVSIMCPARLGLHAEQLSAPAGTCGSGEGVDGGAADPVWCLSASGAVSVAQLLPADEAQALMRLQQKLLQQEGWQSMQQKSVLQVQHGAWDGQLLRQLHKLGFSASYRNFRQVRNARAAAAAHQEAEEDLPFNCVDGDVLFAADDVTDGVQLNSQQQQARLLQHKILQAIL